MRRNDGKTRAPIPAAQGIFRETTRLQPRLAGAAPGWGCGCRCGCGCGRIGRAGIRPATPPWREGTPHRIADKAWPNNRGRQQDGAPTGPGAHGTSQSKWGRHCCRPHSHRRVDSPCLPGFRRTFSRCLRGAMLGARCLAPRHLAPFGTRAGDLSPALAPASGFRSLPAALPLPVGLRRARPCKGAGPRPRPFTGFPRDSPARAALPGSCPARFLACPATPRRSDPCDEPACLWPRPPARGLQIGAWTDAAAILGLKTFARSRRCRPAS